MCPFRSGAGADVVDVETADDDGDRVLGSALAPAPAQHVAENVASTACATPRDRIHTMSRRCLPPHGNCTSRPPPVEPRFTQMHVRGPRDRRIGPATGWGGTAID